MWNKFRAFKKSLFLCSRNFCHLKIIKVNLSIFHQYIIEKDQMSFSIWSVIILGFVWKIEMICGIILKDYQSFDVEAWFVRVLIWWYSNACNTMADDE